MARPRTDIAPRILTAARARFLAHGVDGASLRDIARDARTSIGMVYYYFPTKDALFLAVVDSVYPRLLGDMARALAGDGPLAERIRQVYGRVAGASDEEITVLQIVIREMLSSSDRRKLLIDRFLHGHIPVLLGSVMAGMSSGEIAPGQHPAVVAIATLLLGVFPQVIHRLGSPHLPAGFFPSAEELAAGLSGIVLNGISGGKPSP
jgi:TetR/AcrR family transcriptional regulator